MNDDAREFIAAIGAVAELCGVFYRGLLKNGFSKREALDLTKAYIAATLSNNNN